MDEQRRVPEWKKETKVGIIIALSAVLLFGGMYLISRMTNDNTVTSSTIPTTTLTTPMTTITTGGEVNEPLYDPLAESLEKPFSVNTTIARYFYDMSDDEETRSNAIVEVPGKVNTYTKSVGVDYIYDETFEIVASCSGKVISKSNDLVYGNVVIIEHDSGIRTSYSSLSEITVNKGEKVKQGQVIGKSGVSSYTNGLGQSLHFEIIKGEQYINPEKSYNQLIKTL